MTKELKTELLKCKEICISILNNINIIDLVELIPGNTYIFYQSGNTKWPKGWIHTAEFVKKEGNLYFLKNTYTINITQNKKYIEKNTGTYNNIYQINYNF